MYYAHIGRVMLLYFLQSLYGHLLDDASITRRCKCHQKRGYDEHLKREEILLQIRDRIFTFDLNLVLICKYIVIPCSSDRCLHSVFYKALFSIQYAAKLG